MKKTVYLMLSIVMLTVLAACGDQNSNEPGESAYSGVQAGTPNSASTEPADQQPGTRTITYLGTEYQVAEKAERIVITGALEAMEDSILLDIHPVGAISSAGVFPTMFASITDQAESIGEKINPNFEKILSLKPDVILGSTKFDAAVLDKLGQIQTTIPYSHIATNWEANLLLLGELSGKQEQAQQLIDTYKQDLEQAKMVVKEDLKDKQVLVVRIREGAICIYGPKLYFNPLLYEDLGLSVPDTVAAADSQEALSIEQFAMMNPDVLFIQYSEDENPENTSVLTELEKNPIYQSVNAVKNGQVFVNAVDPLAQGGTAYSKIEFLKAFMAKVKS
ncbi:Iron-uptake system-binding protein precursor [compost metagenome]